MTYSMVLSERRNALSYMRIRFSMSNVFDKEYNDPKANTISQEKCLGVGRKHESRNIANFFMPFVSRCCSDENK